MQCCCAPRGRSLLATIALLLVAAPASAASEFPRGPGLYLNLLSLVAVFAIYLMWVHACAWVDQDARRFDLNRHTWNASIVAGGLAGLAFVWCVPPFAISFPLLCAAVAIPFSLYVRQRNSLVADAQKVLTAQHFKRLLRRWGDREVGVTPETKSGPELHFLPRPGEPPGQERARARRAQRLPGYVAAVDLLCDAVQRRATELVLEPLRDQAHVRLQIDGVYHEAPPFPKQRLDSIVEVVKTWSNLDLQSKTRPLAGSFIFEIEGGRVDFQVAVEEVTGHERTTLKIHDHTQRILRLNQLGMPERIADRIRSALAHRSGLLVVCGPEDSGRTTTAYGCLHELDRMRRGIMTIESPIHQRLARFEQAAYDRASGQTPAEFLRRLLPGTGRQVIFASDIEDTESADMACLKAEEGRIVVITVRAHDAVTGIYRLIELGLTPARLADVLIGVISQRLVRILCKDCKVHYRPDQEALRRANLPPEKINCFCRIPEEGELKRDERGQLMICPTCRGIGFRGRTGIFEVLLLGDRMRELFRANAQMMDIKQEAVKGGMNYLQDEALELVMRGMTSIPEMLQVLRE